MSIKNRWTPGFPPPLYLGGASNFNSPIFSTWRCWMDGGPLSLSTVPLELKGPLPHGHPSPSLSPLLLPPPILEGLSNWGKQERLGSPVITMGCWMVIDFSIDQPYSKTFGSRYGFSDFTLSATLCIGQSPFSSIFSLGGIAGSPVVPRPFSSFSTWS